MLSFSVNSPNLTGNLLSSPFRSSSGSVSLTLRPRSQKTRLRKPISATLIPSPSPFPSELPKLYQPFRPPPSQSPIPPQYCDLDTDGRIDVLSNRLGQWYEYATLIPGLIQEGYAPSTLEEITGMSGVEQNTLVVATKVRESLVESGVDGETLEYFDKGGAELLYEIRLLSASQRAAAAHYLIDNKLEPSGAQELARAIKDFPKRKGDRGWNNFDYTIPGDCLGFMYYRQALEHVDLEQRKSVLERALEVAGSEQAKEWVRKELERKAGEGEGQGRI